MTNEHGKLVSLLKETAKEHHEAFLEVNGHDPEWPHWYAERMHAEFEKMIDQSIGVHGLADLLKRFDQLHSEEAPEEAWADYYADKLLSFYKS